MAIRRWAGRVRASLGLVIALSRSSVRTASLSVNRQRPPPARTDGPEAGQRSRFRGTRGLDLPRECPFTQRENGPTLRPEVANGIGTRTVEIGRASCRERVWVGVVGV